MLVNVSAPVPDESIVPPLLVSVNRRSVLTAAPVYFNVPPSNTKFAATWVEAPILLVLPPLLLGNHPVDVLGPKKGLLFVVVVSH